jgi:hypothetical protein
MGSAHAVTSRDRALLVGVFPSVVGIITYVSLSGLVLRSLFAFAGFAVPMSLGAVAVTWLRDNRRRAYFFALGLGLTITVGGLLFIIIGEIAASGEWS